MGASKVLVTGGAGFIGGHLVDSLVNEGHSVRVVDVRHPFAHLEGNLPINPRAEYLFANIGSTATLREALDGVEVIYHLAAALGMKQSMEYATGFVHYNALATASLLGYLADHPNSVRRLVVASSNTVYGEGPYHCPGCRANVLPPHRALERLQRGQWEQVCPMCGSPVEPVATPESKPLSPTSIYAITKRDQEEMCLVMGRTLELPVIALRFFNVYGPRQSLFNPYAGVCALFESKISRGQVPQIYEDGKQTRDLVSVHDVVRALRLAGASAVPGSVAINVGSGRMVRISEVAEVLGRLWGMRSPMLPTSQYREFDVRHSFADISQARKLLGYAPEVTLEQGLAELVESRRAERRPG